MVIIIITCGGLVIGNVVMSMERLVDVHINVHAT